MNIKSVNIYLCLLLVCAFSISYSQDDSLTLLEDSDDVLIKFENHYFEALKYKAIGNNSLAIIELEKCQQLFPNDKSVDFEFSKNYFDLRKYIQAELYIDKALQQNSDNYWFLELAKKIQLKQYNYLKAIELQQKIILQKPKFTEDLVLIYIQASELEKAQKLIEELEIKGFSSSRLTRFKKTVSNRNRNETKQRIVETKNASLEDLKESFKSNKQFDILKKILQEEFILKNREGLYKYSSQGLELFPAQPYVYLMNGKALISQEKYKDAIDVLMNGIDFVIDDREMMVQCYQQLAIGYEAIGKNKKAENYRNLAIELRK
ncbi:MAG: putative Zn-dependent protease [Candidatus Azotimanducaceae bacterium]|jgi:predicted Zn-dependent protease